MAVGGCITLISSGLTGLGGGGGIFGGETKGGERRGAAGEVVA